MFRLVRAWNYDSLLQLSKGGSFVLPDLVLPEHTCCEDVAQMVKTEHEMTVFSSNAVMTTEYVIMHCRICDVSNRADGKKHGMLVVTDKVLLDAGYRDACLRLSCALALRSNWTIVWAQVAFLHELLYKWKFQFALDSDGFYKFWRSIVAQ